MKMHHMKTSGMMKKYRVDEKRECPNLSPNEKIPTTRCDEDLLLHHDPSGS
jgi:hypothetical protein